MPPRDPPRRPTDAPPSAPPGAGEDGGRILTVTAPFLPPLAEFLPSLERIWASGWLTNGGPFHREFEAALADHLGVPHVSVFANGTIALLAALKSLDLKGEVITTPYSFIATAHSLLWNGIRPVFADIDPDTFNLDPRRVEEAVTPSTTAILPVHVYGRPCDVTGLGRVADRHGLRLVYDAAHAFGVNDAGGSLLRHGDLSVLSFHATKVFHTFEGGAVVCRDAVMKRRLDDLKNFGIENEISVRATGINGKMNELQAAFGLLQLKHVDQAIEARRRVDAHYRRALAEVPGIRCLPLPSQASANFGYFPILVDPDAFGRPRDTLYEHLKHAGVLARRYFHPLITEFPMYSELPSASPNNLPCAARIASRVLCLPIYPGLGHEDVERVVALVRACASAPRRSPLAAEADLPLSHS